MAGRTPLSLNDTYNDRPLAKRTADSHVPQVAKRLRMYRTQVPQGVKYYDTEFSLTFLNDTVSTGQTVANTLVPVIQGTGTNDRLGQDIVLRRIEWRMYIETNTVATATMENLAVWVYYDQNPNGALPLVMDLLGPPQGTAFMTGSRPPYLYPNQENRERFTILWKKMWTPPQVATAAGGQRTDITGGTLPFQVRDPYRVSPVQSGYKDLHGKTANYKPNTAGPFAITDLKTGALNILAVGAETPTPSWKLVGTIRVTFTDLNSGCC